MKIKAVILIGITIILVVAGLYYYNFRTSPQYSLLQLKKSFEDHDVTAFEKYVDVKTVADGIVDELMNGNGSSSSESEKLGEGLAKGLVNLLRPQLEEFWKTQFLRIVETGVPESDTQNKSFSSFWKKQEKVSFNGISDITKEGKVANLELELFHPRFQKTIKVNVPEGQGRILAVVRDSAHYIVCISFGFSGDGQGECPERRNKKRYQ